MRHVTIAISTYSPMVFHGLCSILHHIKDCSVRFEQILPGELSADVSMAEGADMLIVDPFVTDHVTLNRLKTEIYPSPRIVVLYHSALPVDLVKAFDGAMSVYDSEPSILSTIRSILNLNNSDNGLSQLTAREKEIIVGVVKGLSNKEIAAEMNVSVNTVTTHRRNIAAKLQIHSPAGLTIYALVSKLVKLEEIAADVKS